MSNNETFEEWLSRQDVKTASMLTMRHLWNDKQVRIIAFQARVEELEKENQRLKDELKLERECVDFYANKENWRAVTIHQSPTMLKSDLELTDPHEDYHCRRGGKRARQRQKERREIADN